MEPSVRRLREDDWECFRDIRLTALVDAPMAFGSSYARELGFGEAEWRARLRNGVSFVAEVTTTCGLVGCIAQPAGADNVRQLVAMWVSPDMRGSGVADALVEAVLSWARADGADAVVLFVVEDNARARRLYERHGFEATGYRTPLPHNPALDEIEMRLDLDL